MAENSPVLSPQESDEKPLLAQNVRRRLDRSGINTAGLDFAALSSGLINKLHRKIKT